jgi:hypothetical protein
VGMVVAAVTAVVVGMVAVVDMEAADFMAVEAAASMAAAWVVIPVAWVVIPVAWAVTTEVWVVTPAVWAVTTEGCLVIPAAWVATAEQWAADPAAGDTAVWLATTWAVAPEAWARAA